MKKLFIFIVIVIVLILIAFGFDYSNVDKGQKPIFVFGTNKYTYSNGEVIEYIGPGYKIVDYSGVSDFKNIKASLIFSGIKKVEVDPTLKVDIRGKLVNEMLNKNMLVETTVNGATSYDKVWVQIDSDTIIKRLSTGKITSVDSIDTDYVLEIGFKGKASNASPPWAHANYIVILDQ